MLRYGLHRIRWALTGFSGFSLSGHRNQKWMTGLKKEKDKGILFRRLNQFSSIPLEQQSKFENCIFSKCSFKKKNGLINLCKSLYLKFSIAFSCLLRSALGHLSLKHGEDWADQWKKPEDTHIKESSYFPTSRDNQQMKNSNINSVINF